MAYQNKLSSIKTRTRILSLDDSISGVIAGLEESNMQRVGIAPTCP